MSETQTIDLAIAYRIYPGVTRTPAFFQTNKFELAKMCLRSFKKALGGLRVRIWALLDGCPPEYEALFRDTFESRELEVVPLNKIGNFATFSLQIDLLTRQTDAPYVYFAEDDFFYFPNALEQAVTFMRENRDADFVTIYDHPDSYYTSSRWERHLVRPSGGHYWRTASSTTLTFLTSRENLLRTESTFRSYSRGNHDCSVWLALTQKLALANPKIQWSDRQRFNIWARTWISGVVTILFQRKYQLWVPMPALGTHMDAPCVSPLIDWQSEFRQADSKASG